MKLLLFLRQHISFGSFPAKCEETIHRTGVRFITAPFKSTLSHINSDYQTANYFPPINHLQCIIQSSIPLLQRMSLNS